MENQDKSQIKKKRNFLVIYSVALFLFAALLIGLSYLSQARVANEANKVKQELSDKTEVATGFETRLEQVNKKNTELVTENLDLKKQLDDMAKKNTELSSANAITAAKNLQVQELTKRAAAADYMWRIVRAFVSSNYNETKRLIAEVDAKQYRILLSKDALAEFLRIEKIVKGV
ncbi:MAG: hypothetical protein RSC43_04985 [Clostridia bacterium]